MNQCLLAASGLKLAHRVLPSLSVGRQRLQNIDFGKLPLKYRYYRFSAVVRSHLYFRQNPKYLLDRHEIKLQLILILY